MNNEQDFQVKEIKQEKIPIYSKPPKKKLGLISLFTKKNIPKTLLIVVIIAILVAVAAIIWGRSSFSRARVEINIEAPTDIASGEDILLSVNYKNNNRVNLYDTYLIINYPSGTFSSEGKEIFQEEKKLGTVSRKSEGKEEFKIRFVGEKGDIKNISAKLDYRPQNINSRFENTFSLRTEINSVLIGVSIEGSEKAISGQGVSYIVEYENETDEDVSGLRIELSYPDDFKFDSANPKPDAEFNNVWEIGIFKSGEKQSIEIKGLLNGQEGESKAFRALIGKIENKVFLQYGQSEIVTQISPSPLPLFIEIQRLEGDCNLNPSQKLDYKIEFRNNTDVALSELILKAYFQDNVFDFKNLELGGIGFFDSQKNIITWSGAEVPALNLLESNQSDYVTFSVNIKESLPIFSYNDKNFQARVLAEIETLTVPSKFAVSELRMERELICKVNSHLDLSTKVYYYEPEPGIINIGPMPPRVDQLTTYTVHWQIINTSNDLENVKVWAILPQGINWQNYYINKVSGSNVSYNDRTKEIIWEIDKIPAGTGVILPIYELIFQIGLRPSINQVGQKPTLINESSVDGKDTFTEVVLKDYTPEVDTSLPDDPKVTSLKWRVKE